MRRAVFLDRDGVLNRNVWNSATEAYESPLTPEQFELLPKVVPALKLLRDAGYLLFLVSNQPNHAKGKADMEVLEEIHRKFEMLLTAEGIVFSDYYYCFHHPNFTGACRCRKPSPYFLFEARDRFDVDLAQSWMIGDRVSDIACGRAAGTRTIGISPMTQSQTGADCIADDLWRAAQIITCYERASIPDVLAAST
ncbi:HAD-IIIA family hydrolase [Acidobacterium sp. S8]|uniref:D-glycero-alpha-D-manno-heptose-1,7-bisphosphate 7-phosphatase n=1 Tax=Acidobacterium sp. S8 TaxID=1641854 RepID=UPI00210F7E3A|nr:HAD family hydrolase [Acidobacterium sp. S8]